MGSPVLTGQLADDITLFLKNAGQIPKVLSSMLFFSEASGLTLNIKTCKSIHRHSLTP